MKLTMAGNRSGGSGSSQLTLNVTATQASIDVRAALGVPVGAYNVVVNISSGVVVYGDGAAYALRLGTGWTAGCTFRINNSGTIAGDGGNGGTGSDGSSPGTNGAAGSAAIELNGQTCSIDNTSGFIYGGGGGGGGGGSTAFGSVLGGGGGGGQAGSASSGGAGGGVGATAGGNGSISGPGTYGLPSGGTTEYGGPGGVFGANGQDGSGGVWRAFGLGGAAGKAVNRSGGSTIWLGGNNASQVKGVDS